MQGGKTERDKEREVEVEEEKESTLLSRLSRFAKICSTYYAQLASSE